MNIDLTNIIEKGEQYIVQAVFQDEAHNYELARQAYMAAVDCFIHATKYGIMKEELKQHIHVNVEKYVKRAEEIKKMIENETLIDDTTNFESLKDKINNQDIEESTHDEHLIQNIIVTDSKVTFDDVIGLVFAKTVLLESVILPAKYPKLFQDKCKPSASVLLYGSVGIGKTYLATSIANECKVKFISLNAWELQSKFLNEPEKLIRKIFELAHQQQPSILFIDDIDSLSEQNTGIDDDRFHRIKTEFLIQTENIENGNTNTFLIVASTKPFELDATIQRKFEKRIYIPLPDINERVAMLKKTFDSNINHTINENEWIQLAEKTENYSPADITVICHEAVMAPIRQLVSATHFKQMENPESNGPPQLWFICSSDDINAKVINLNEIKSNELYIPPVTMSDMLTALDKVKPTTSQHDLLEYQQFSKENS